MQKPEMFVSALCVGLIVLLSSCSKPEPPPSRNKNDSANYPFSAEVLFADSEKIRIRYSLTNNTTDDRIVFDVGRSSPRATVSDKGKIRLFKGQYDAKTQFDEPLFLQGQVLSAGETIAENIERALPIIRDFGDKTEYPLGELEFCIGHASPTDQVKTDDPAYPYSLTGQTKLNRTECVILSAP